jgi:UDP-N-acetylglucosamine--N-acetylmuramyl-(pentapeptide) pyrophosphoryl-undecaprenol N-acetylglucosamine transferase
MRVLFSGGGTGGHIFPAISIANAIKELRPDTDILFVGAEGRMEMHRVPAAGYPIKGLPVAGFDRKNLLKNIPVLIKLFKSQRLARKIIKDFRPHAAVGVGGYASGPTLKVAGSNGIPTLLQEQNSYAGVTNKLLAKQAHKICVAYEGMERFFDKDKIILTGNPVRQGLRNHQLSREESIRFFNLDPSKKTILILGGSLGARTINQCLMSNLDKVKASGVQFIWQTGKIYIDEARESVAKFGKLPMLHVTDFIIDRDIRNARYRFDFRFTYNKSGSFLFGRTFFSTDIFYKSIPFTTFRTFSHPFGSFVSAFGANKYFFKFFHYFKLPFR